MTGWWTDDVTNIGVIELGYVCLSLFRVRKLEIVARFNFLSHRTQLQFIVMEVFIQNMHPSIKIESNSSFR